MVKSNTLKKNVDKKQDARIRRLEKLNPMIDELIHSHSQVLAPVQSTWALYAPYPAALHTEKVVLRGLTLRATGLYNTTVSDGATVRMVLLLYKSDVDYSQSPPVVTAPTPADIFVSHGQLAFINPDIQNRVKILRDSSKFVNNNTLSSMYFSQNKNYKKGLPLMPAIDRAFVWRPYILYYNEEYGAQPTNTPVLEFNVEMRTRQIQ